MNNLQDIALLCALAEKYDWETLHAQLKIILEKTRQQDVAKLAIDYVQLYSPHFGQLYPNETWLEDCIRQVRESMFSDTLDEQQLGLFPERDRKYPTPVARTFKSAVSSIWSMARWKHKTPVFAEYATDAISIMITVLRSESASWHPKELDSLFRNTDDSIEVGKLLWLDLAQKLKPPLECG
ncbi:MAG: hypothetical protein K8I30_06890 [Anaerolineae bacterium]|nr:hypothetical protein [Anaerolineae bacterium]